MTFLAFLVSCFITLNPWTGHGSPAYADSESPGQKTEETGFLEEGIEGPLTGFHLYWKEGLRIEGHYEKVKFKIGGKFLVDGGAIDPDSELETAFPDLDGSSVILRRASVSIIGNLFNNLEGKLEVDFANAGDIKDNWVRFTKFPVLDHIRFGHQKEPVSLEELASIKDITFMERAMPTGGLTPGRNMGIQYNDSFLGGRMTWALGGFWESGSFSEVGDGRNQISGPSGYNLSTRITGLPWYEEKGRKFVHLGLSFSYQIRDEDDPDYTAQLRSRPESRLTDDRLVDTDEFSVDGKSLMGAEFAFLSGPFSLQGEYLRLLTNSTEGDNPDFWGYYLFGSYILTGENRGYNPSSGVFTGVKPRHAFQPFKGGWGAWELALRYSYLDLNDGNIEGGKERNITAGLNWYLYPGIRMMFNYIHAKVEDRASPVIENGRSDIYQLRFQVAF